MDGGVRTCEKRKKDVNKERNNECGIHTEERLI